MVLPTHSWSTSIGCFDRKRSRALAALRLLFGRSSSRRKAKPMCLTQTTGFCIDKTPQKCSTNCILTPLYTVVFPGGAPHQRTPSKTSENNLDHLGIGGVMRSSVRRARSQQKAVIMSTTKVCQQMPTQAACECQESCRVLALDAHLVMYLWRPELHYGFHQGNTASKLLSSLPALRNTAVEMHCHYRVAFMRSSMLCSSWLLVHILLRERAILG